MPNRPSFSRAAITLVMLIASFYLTISCAHREPVRIVLISDQRTYGPDDPITFQVRVINENVNFLKQKQPLVTNRGFFSRDYHLLLTITDPEGVRIARKHAAMAKEPQPPYRRQGKFLVPVDVIPSGQESVYVVKDARAYYEFKDKSGWYTAYLGTSLQTFCNYETLPTGEVVSDVTGKYVKTFNPLTSNRIRFELTP